MLMDGDRGIDLEEFSREALMDLTKAWRRRALRGDRTAHGPAYACDVVDRRRFGLLRATPAAQYLRPLVVPPLTRRRRLRFSS